MTRTAAPPTRSPEPDGPRQVSKLEFNLLRILRFALGQWPADQGLQLVRAVVAYGAAHPPALREKAGVLALLALRAAFPCRKE